MRSSARPAIFFQRLIASSSSSYTLAYRSRSAKPKPPSLCGRVTSSHASSIAPSLK
jgi:hypothetical protein